MGFGLGIALGAMLLQLINFAEANDKMLMSAEESKMYSQQELDDAVKEAVHKAELLAAQSTSSPSPSANGSDSGDGQTDMTPPTGSADGTPLPEDGGQSNPNGGEDERVVAFYVNRNMSLMAVARSLKALGVIEDADDFTQAARPVSKRIAIGTSVFSGKPTYEEIIAELTRPKDD